MAVHNASAFVAKALDSILRQSFGDFEFLIVDDGSDDDSIAIVESYDDSRVRLERNDRNIGLTCSLNRGLALARGRYIARMDADDVSLAERFAKQVTFLEDHSQVGVLGTGFQLIDGEGTIDRQHHCFPEDHRLLRWLLCFENPLVHSSVMIRRETLQAAGGYAEHMVTSQDYELWCRLSETTELANLSEVLVRLRKHADSVSARVGREGADRVVEVSRQMISRVSGVDLTAEDVRPLWCASEAGPADCLRTARMIRRLWRVAVSAPDILPAERRFVRRDAGTRLLNLVRLPFWNRSTWETARSAHAADCLVMVRHLLSRLARAAGVGRVRHVQYGRGTRRQRCRRQGARKPLPGDATASGT